MIVRTGKQMRDAYLTGGKDSSLIRWTVIMREKGRTPNYAALDTFALMVVRGTITAIDESNLIPETFSLAQNYPNPFNPSTVIRYGLPQQSHVGLDVFNVIGQKVATLVNENQEAGYHEVNFSGSNLPSGIYFARLQAGDFSQASKLVLLK